MSGLYYRHFILVFATFAIGVAVPKILHRQYFAATHHRDTVNFQRADQPGLCPARNYGETATGDPDFTPESARCSELTSQLLTASNHGDLPGVADALERGAIVNASYSHAGRALNHAITVGRNDVAKYLIIRGASLTETDGMQGPPLTIAAINDNEELVRVLIESGADPCATFLTDDLTRPTALDSARNQNATRVIGLLQQASKERCF